MGVVRIVMALFFTLCCAACGSYGGDIEAEATDGGEPIAQTTEAVVVVSASVSQGAWKYYEFPKTAGWRYTVCINVTSGNADLYGYYGGNPTTTTNDNRSTNTATKSDCISFNASQNGTYYVGVLGVGSGTSSFTYRRTSSDNLTIPSYLKGKLKASGCGGPTYAKYGPFNSPWGNPSFDPNFSGYTNYIHNGTDLSCAPKTAVKAACSGTIKKVGDLGFEVVNGVTYPWGKYSLLECNIGGKLITLAYDHLNTAGQLPLNSQTVAGQTVIGTIYDLNFPGELDHLHLGLCLGSATACSGVAQNGAVADTAFQGLMLNVDNPALYGP